MPSVLAPPPVHCWIEGVLESVRKALRAHACESHAKACLWYFKTGPGEYGEGDRFIGVRMPQIRRLAREFRDLPLTDTVTLLQSDIHEERLLALILLNAKYAKAATDEQTTIYKLYLANTRHINNWDLVDTSAHRIVGPHLRHRSRRPLYRLARSKSLWERRIAIMATVHFITANDYDDTLDISERLLADSEDLIHKAVGWMLREVGNRDRKVEETFLKKHYQMMPRTMLRYAIEKFPEGLRQKYLKGKI